MISQPCNQDFFFFMSTAMKIPFMHSSVGNCAHGLQPCNQDLVHCDKNPIYVFLFWELRGLPGEVVEPGTTHDLQPCNQDFYTATKIPIMYFSSGNWAHDLQPCSQDFYTATKIPFMYSFSGNCAGCQGMSWNQVPRMISSPAIRICFCNVELF
jgi:hypothetical protein